MTYAQYLDAQASETRARLTRTTRLIVRTRRLANRLAVIGVVSFVAGMGCILLAGTFLIWPLHTFGVLLLGGGVALLLAGIATQDSLDPSRPGRHPARWWP